MWRNLILTDSASQWGSCIVTKNILGVALILFKIHCVHTSINVRKVKFISYIYTLFLYRFVHYLRSSEVKQAAKKIYSQTCLVFMFNSRLNEETSIECYVGLYQLFHA